MRKQDPAYAYICAECGQKMQASASQQVRLSFNALLDAQQHGGVPWVKS